MHTAVSRESIQKANALFWDQMLAMEMEPVPELPGTSDPVRSIGARQVVGSCSFSGAWQGRIEVRLSWNLALEATSAMLMQPAGQVQIEDLLDAAKEIANMIAGSLKSALPRPCAMTVPSAEIETTEFCIQPRASDSVTVCFQHAAGGLMVRVSEQSAVEESDDCILARLCA
jgi:CheY-specific phosphatase CheX